jgi:predicted DNA-binding WGR domain protein
MTTRRFLYTTGGANKFWELEVSDSELRVRFGKVGTDGQEVLKSFPNEAKAGAAAEKLIRENP